MKRCLSVLCLLILIATDLHAAVKVVIKGNNKNDFSAAVLTAGSDVVTEDLVNGQATLTFPDGATSGSLTIITDEGKATPVYGRVCASDDDGKVSCKTGTRGKVYLTFKSTAGTVTIKYDSHGYFLVNAKGALAAYKRKFLTSTKLLLADAATSQNFGYYGASGANSIKSLSRKLRIHEGETSDGDLDDDGAPDVSDIDDDNDGLTDNFDNSNDSDATDPLRIFSNFKLNIVDSLNVNANPSLTQPEIDSAMQITTTLAIAVLGTNGSGDISRLDCNGLSYCSLGGTGVGVNSGTEFPEEFDTADDGLGVIERGPTGDFQLRTGASSSLIGAGDTIIQTVTHADSSTEEFAGMLNFVFNTTPALKSVTIDSTTTTVDYTRTDTREGGNLNCFSAASSGDVIITVTGWRPQRPGIASAGEGNFVDIGNSAFVFDIPNAPCTISGGGGCSGNGPGNCGASSYSTSDANLTIGSNGLQDSRGDIDADVTNTYTFTVNLGTCLGSQAADWGAGETLFIDLQARSQDGDNAAQKFCVTRAP